MKKQISAWMHDDDYFTSGSDGEMKERKSWLDKSWKRLAEMVKVPAEDVWDK